MCCMALTTATMPGRLVTSMCWISVLRNFFLAALAPAFAFIGFLLAIGDSPRVGTVQSSNAKKPPRLATVSLWEGPAIAGRGGFGVKNCSSMIRKRQEGVRAKREKNF